MPYFRERFYAREEFAGGSVKPVILEPSVEFLDGAEDGMGLARGPVMMFGAPGVGIAPENEKALGAGGACGGDVGQRIADHDQVLGRTPVRFGDAEQRLGWGLLFSTSSPVRIMENRWARPRASSVASVVHRPLPVERARAARRGAVAPGRGGPPDKRLPRAFPGRIRSGSVRWRPRAGWCGWRGGCSSPRWGRNGKPLRRHRAGVRLRDHDGVEGVDDHPQSVDERVVEIEHDGGRGSGRPRSGGRVGGGISGGKR
jgi:hypothetical protein